MPVNADLVKDFEKTLKKTLVGFVYFKDLEERDDIKLLYINMFVEAGKEKGKYVADMSLEVFCGE